MPCSGPRGPAGLALGVERVGDRQRVGIELDDRAQGRPGAIDLVDPLQVQLRPAGARCSARAAIPSCSCAIVASSSSKAPGGS